MTETTVYVGKRATMDQVRAAVEAWQRSTGDRTRVFIDEDGDDHPEMGFAIDVYGDGADAAARRLAEGIREYLRDIPIVVDAGDKSTGPAGQQEPLLRSLTWLERFIDNLEQVQGETALDFVEATIDAWGNAVTDEQPQAHTAASLLMSEAGREMMQVAVDAALDHQITRADSEASLAKALRDVRQRGVLWASVALPNSSEIAERVEAIKASFRMAQRALEARKAEDDAADAEAVANPYGAILGYQDANVDAAIIFTPIRSFSKLELDRYADAYERLKRIVDAPLLRYVSDMAEALTSVLDETLSAIKQKRLSLANVDAADRTWLRIRNSVIAFTSALHSHQTQTYWQAQEQYGKDSDEYRKLESLFHDIYDNSDGYMWLYELRHVLLHVTVDAVTFKLTARLDGEPTLELNMSRYWMSRSSGVMEKKYKRERFEALTEDPSVLDMMGDVQRRFVVLQREIHRILFPNVAKDAETVRELIGMFNGRRGIYALQLGPGFTRRLKIPPYMQLAPRVLSFAHSYEPVDEPDDSHQ